MSHTKSYALKKRRQGSTKKWDKLVADTSALTDGANYRIDSGILELVAALRGLGFHTTGSCEGHIERGVPAPWVDIGDQPHPDLIQRTKQKRGIEALLKDPKLLKQKLTNLKEQEKLLKLLDSYYHQRHRDTSARLVILPTGIFGAMRLTMQGRDLQALYSKNKQRKTLVQFQAETTKFARFLRKQL